MCLYLTDWNVLYVIYEYCFTYITHCEIQRKTCHLIEWNFLYFASSAVPISLELTMMIPPFVNESPSCIQCGYLCVLCMLTACVCSFRFPNAYSTVDIYVFLPL